MAAISAALRARSYRLASSIRPLNTSSCSPAGSPPMLAPRPRASVLGKIKPVQGVEALSTPLTYTLITLPSYVPATCDHWLAGSTTLEAVAKADPLGTPLVLIVSEPQPPERPKDKDHWLTP